MGFPAIVLSALCGGGAGLLAVMWIAGGWKRTIRITESGGSIRIKEEGDDGSEGLVEEFVEGPAAARDLILADVAHLLDERDGSQVENAVKHRPSQDRV